MKLKYYVRWENGDIQFSEKATTPIIIIGVLITAGIIIWVIYSIATTKICPMGSTC